MFFCFVFLFLEGVVGVCFVVFLTSPAVLIFLSYIITYFCQFLNTCTWQLFLHLQQHSTPMSKMTAPVLPWLENGRLYSYLGNLCYLFRFSGLVQTLSMTFLNLPDVSANSLFDRSTIRNISLLTCLNAPRRIYQNQPVFIHVLAYWNVCCRQAYNYIHTIF